MKGRGQQANDAAQGEAPGEQAALWGDGNESTVAGVHEAEKGEDEVGEKPGLDLQPFPR